MSLCTRMGAIDCTCDGNDECYVCCQGSTNPDRMGFCPQYYAYKSLYNNDTYTYVATCYLQTENGTVNSNTPTAIPIRPFDGITSCVAAYSVIGGNSTYEWILNGDSGPAFTPQQANLTMSTGTFCSSGICSAGVCAAAGTDGSTSSFFTNFNVEVLAAWLKANIVAACLIIGTLVMAPLFFCVCRYDNAQLAKLKAQRAQRKSTFKLVQNPEQTFAEVEAKRAKRRSHRSDNPRNKFHRPTGTGLPMPVSSYY